MIITSNASIAEENTQRRWLNGIFQNVQILLTNQEELSHQKFNKNMLEILELQASKLKKNQWGWVWGQENQWEWEWGQEV